ncbi:MAG: HAD-IIIC family phosphatase [Chloroflexi bacterium]|nr:HAD-IIIC family phosphatase [Chloroflexota bacterium]
MSKQRYRCLALSDFNMGNFASYLANDDSSPAVEVYAAPYGQVWQVLIDSQHPIWRNEADFAVVWTRPESVVPSFGRLLNFENVPTSVLLEEVDQYADALVRALEPLAFAFVPTWVMPPYMAGLLDWREGTGAANALAHMNLRLAERLAGHSKLYLLNAQRWVDAVGQRAHSPKLWYMAKIAFGNDVFLSAVESIKAGLRGLSGRAKKLLILDLDDTLWGGIVGDVGWENLQLGGHDAVGEALVDFQVALQGLKRRGVVLGVVSKNDERVALEAIEKHPEMKLRRQDLAHWKINWNDKAQNIAELVHELNLGLESAVFIDDNPVERARVREALPDVLVPEWPQDKMLYKSALLSLTCFDAPAISAEDAARTEMYVAERERKDTQMQVGSVEEWLETLDITVTATPLTPENATRTAQLLNKTNQMNLSTRRLSEAELWRWLEAPGRALWTFHVTDRFGDSGLTGIASGEVDGSTLHVVDYLLSCRVMGRKVEETMLALLVAHAREQGCETVVATYVPTAKNRPCLEFFQRSDFHGDAAGEHFTWSTHDDYPVPAQLRLEVKPPQGETAS